MPRAEKPKAIKCSCLCVFIIFLAEIRTMIFPIAFTAISVPVVEAREFLVQEVGHCDLGLEYVVAEFRSEYG